MSIFVPAPQADRLAATMDGMSVLGVLSLLRERQVSGPGMVVVSAVYAALAAALPPLFRSL